jgi:hypothetical protein
MSARKMFRSLECLIVVGLLVYATRVAGSDNEAKQLCASYKGDPDAVRGHCFV